jgi:hypothetical protein
MSTPEELTKVILHSSNVACYLENDICVNYFVLTTEAPGFSPTRMPFIDEILRYGCWHALIFNNQNKLVINVPWGCTHRITEEKITSVTAELLKNVKFVDEYTDYDGGLTSTDWIVYTTKKYII